MDTTGLERAGRQADRAHTVLFRSTVEDSRSEPAETHPTRLWTRGSESPAEGPDANLRARRLDLTGRPHDESVLHTCLLAGCFRTTSDQERRS